MRKIQQITEITQTLPLYQESELLSFYRSGFESSELGGVHRLFPFSAIAESFGLKSSRVGRKSFFSPEGKIALMVLKSYTGLSDRKLVEQINGSIYFQFFCGIFIRTGESMPGRIVSIDKHYVRPIVRGKETKTVEYGAKVNLIQVDGLNFIEHISFKPFNEGTRGISSIQYARLLFRKKVTHFAADAIYATNKTRKYCSSSPSPIYTGFVRKGKKARDEDQRSKLRSLLSRERSTRLEGSFGTEKEHYNLRKVKARTEETEILWIMFGVHTANAVRLAGRQQQNKQEKAA